MYSLLSVARGGVRVGTGTERGTESWAALASRKLCISCYALVVIAAAAAAATAVLLFV